MATKKEFENKIYAENRRAFYDYKILDTYEAGIKLFGFEVKAVRAGRANLTASYCSLHNGELFLLNAKIPPYQKKNASQDFNEERSRKLLLKKQELAKIRQLAERQKLTIVPLKLYNKNNLVKIEIGLAKGLKKYEKKEKIKKREAEIEMEREARE